MRYSPCSASPYALLTLANPLSAMTILPMPNHSFTHLKAFEGFFPQSYTNSLLPMRAFSYGSAKMMHPVSLSAVVWDSCPLLVGLRATNIHPGMSDPWLATSLSPFPVQRAINSFTVMMDPSEN